ncbi:hypothetical protein O181_042161 [Austropuccinia psidii MF-1]|uniref:Uncharacterized protein n=1 Tax=Austropuccinia psidii MF-1 TaxID=1389203 RepID=A0A9Q3DL38_9BASI|nr:hypothetical protein [Austropuccinia psidii MF-1]
MGKTPSQFLFTESQSSTNAWPIGHIINPRPFYRSWRGMALWPFWAIFNLTNPQANTPKFEPGGHPLFQGPLAPLAQGPKAPGLAISLKTQAMASGNHQRTPATLNKEFSIKIKETSGQVCGNQEWCIYGIIYHYAPFFLGNSIVKFSGLHYAISNKVPRPITHFKRRLQPLGLTIHGSYQKTI